MLPHSELGRRLEGSTAPSRYGAWTDGTQAKSAWITFEPVIMQIDWRNLLTNLGLIRYVLPPSEFLSSSMVERLAVNQ
jgi:hypothetical protein